MICLVPRRRFSAAKQGARGVVRRMQKEGRLGTRQGYYGVRKKSAGAL